MKKNLLFILLISIFISSCTTYHQYTKSQRIVLKKFEKKRHGKYIPIRKSVRVSDPTIKKDTRRAMIQRIRSQRMTISN